MFDDRYFARNARYPAPPARRSIAADGPAAEVFRTSPVEPWRVVRTRLRVAGKVPGPIEGGGRAAGYFTGATGVTIYRGHAWPAEMHGQAIVGDVGGNLVHRKALSANGLSLTGKRIDEQCELLASTDNWFRPVQFAQAPDGCLYVIDMDREVIEHPASLPPEIKRHLDLTSGRDRGRIWRIAPERFQATPPPRLDNANSVELVSLLSHANGWHRDTAARLLCERRDPAAVPLLASAARSAAEPLGRLHALYVLDALEALDAALLLAALDDPHPGIRRHAVRLAERQIAGNSAIGEKLIRLTGDPDPLVRYQLAFTLGELPGKTAGKALAKILAARSGRAVFAGCGVQLARESGGGRARAADRRRGVLLAAGRRRGSGATRAADRGRR